MNTYHTPVLLNEVISGLCIKEGRRYIDATVGGGGHAIEIVKHGGIVLGIDVDREAIEYSKEKFKIKNSKFKENRDWFFIQGNFKDIEQIAKEHGFGEVDGILFDLGVSSHQLDTKSRGFSYRFPDALLDLRMDQSRGMSAREYLQTVSKEELYDILATFGEEEHSRTINTAIHSIRTVKPIDTTGALFSVIENAVGKRNAYGSASRIFQALRIVINDELNTLEKGLQGAMKLLAVAGRIAVISFH